MLIIHLICCCFDGDLYDENSEAHTETKVFFTHHNPHRKRFILLVFTNRLEDSEFI